MNDQIKRLKKVAYIIGFSAFICSVGYAQAVNHPAGQRVPPGGDSTGPPPGGDSTRLPLDTAVHWGRLPNGFTYLIRRNITPAGRVQLYLVNKVGSVLEDEDQRGLAHFMEHMNFNGTKHFPKNELVDYLQKAGIVFGADLNAHTSYDETVYELPIPTDDPAMVVSGLQIVRDWAQDALLDSVEIEKERGVVLEEERLGKGAGERMSRLYEPMLFNGSRYAERIPIGLDDVLIHFKPETIRRFHHDWYRPDLQELVVVGDIDVRQVERLVREKFSDLKNPEHERPRTVYAIPLTGKNQFMALTDKEMPSASLEILIKHKAPPLSTYGDFLGSMKRALFNNMLSARLFAVASGAEHMVFATMQAGIKPMLGGMDMFAFQMDARTDLLESGFKQAWGMVEQVRRFGFTQPELDRALWTYLRNMDAGMKEQDKTPSVDWVKQYEQFFLGGQAAPGAEWEYRFVKEHLSSIKLADVNAVAAEYIRDVNRDILVMAPDRDKDRLPDSLVVTGWINEVDQSRMQPYIDDIGRLPLLTAKPAGGKVISESPIPELNVTQLTLNNGVRVILKPTDFKNDEIDFFSFAPGGTSLYDGADFENAAIAGQLIPGFGVGGLDPVQLSGTLNGKLVKVSPYIGSRSQGVQGSCAPPDLETALQLVYLQLTRPRKDSLMFARTMSRARQAQVDRYADPGTVFKDTMAYVMGNYNERAAPPSLQKLDVITLEKSYEIFKERFANAGDQTFVLVGNFNTDSIRPLLELYLGALPATGKTEQARDLGIHIPGGRLNKYVYKGKENKAMVNLVISGGYAYSDSHNLELTALCQILQIKLEEHLREDEGEVYSPSVKSSVNEYPRNRYMVNVTFGCAPGNVEHLIGMVRKEMDLLVGQGPDAVDVEKFKMAYTRNRELALRDNGFWLDYLVGRYQNGDAVLQVLDRPEELRQMTAGSLRAAAKTFFDDRNIIRFVWMPDRAVLESKG
jgi:zinc protease